MKFLKDQNLILVFCCLALSIIPIFWFKIGEIDLGGDSSRLYFYDPLSYLKNFSLYWIVPEGLGVAEPHFYFLPHLVLLIVLKSILKSPYLLIYAFNLIKIAGGFLGIYFIVKELVKYDLPKKRSEMLVSIVAIIAGLFYIFSPPIAGNYGRALLSHNQVFLNPIMFYLVLKYVITSNFRFFWVALILSFLFSPNFGMTSAPAFFAFYPLSMLFILLYTKIVRKVKIPLKGLLVGFLIFLALHSFHLVPQIISLFDPGSFINVRVFSRESITHEGIRYFLGVLPLVKTSINLLFPPLLPNLFLLYFTTPLVIIVGLLLSRRDKTILLTSLFFLIVFFFATANITSLGVEFYKKLFYVPGFSIFRNFYGQWQFTFAFYYTLLFGLATSVIFSKIRVRYVKILSATLLLFLTVGAWPFISGKIVNQIHPQSNNVKIPIIMDPDFERALSFVKKIPNDAKILTLPFTDSFYQVVAGREGGAYVGPSIVSYLGGKKDFSGYQTMTAPFSELFFQFARGKDYEKIKNLLKILGVGYIFYNSDARIYDTSFPAFPYEYSRSSLPESQNEYRKFVEKIAGKKVFSAGPYALYEVDKKYFLQHFYVPEGIVINRAPKKNEDPYTVLFENGKNKVKTVYIEDRKCKELLNLCGRREISVPSTSFKKINPTKYRVKVVGAKEPFILVFLEAYHWNWKVVVSEVKQISEASHFIVNGYANGWYIEPKDTRGLVNYELIVEMGSQKIFYVTFFVTLITFLVLILWGIISFFKMQFGIIRTK